MEKGKKRRFKEEYEDAAKKVKNLIRSAKRNMEKRLAHDKEETLLQLCQKKDKKQSRDWPHCQFNRRSAD